MPDIFQYTDFRSFLRDYYSEQKSRLSGFSYKLLSEKAGFSNKGFVYNILHGTKKLSKTSAYKLSKALKLNRTEADYFENMVFFNQAKNSEEGLYFFDRMLAGGGKKQTNTAQIIRKEQYEFYSNWYYSAIWSIIEMHPFYGDFEWLASSIEPQLKTGDVKKAVDILLRLGLLIKDPEGKYSATNKTISTGHETLGTALVHYHLDNLQLAARALRKQPRYRRNFSGLTLGISEATYNKIIEELKVFQERVLKIASEDDHSDQVYQCNFQMFPLTPENGVKRRDPK